jgi:hypothetical protein
MIRIIKWKLFNFTSIKADHLHHIRYLFSFLQFIFGVMSDAEFFERITDPAIKELMVNFLVRDLSKYGLKSKAGDAMIEILADDTEDWTVGESNALVALWVLIRKPKIKLVTKVAPMFYGSVVRIHHDFWNSLDIDLFRPYLARSL